MHQAAAAARRLISVLAHKNAEVDSLGSEVSDLYVRSQTRWGVGLRCWRINRARSLCVDPLPLPPQKKHIWNNLYVNLVGFSSPPLYLFYLFTYFYLFFFISQCLPPPAPQHTTLMHINAAPWV